MTVHAAVVAAGLVAGHPVGESDTIPSPEIAAASTPAMAQEHPRRDFRRPDAFVAATETFSFFSDPRVNLHDFLVWRLRSDTVVDPRPACLSGLPTEHADAIPSAAEFYRRLVDAGPGGDDHLLDLRFHLVGYPDVEIGADSVVDAGVRRLDAALPAYEECWWPDHDARNRSWIGDMVPRLIAHESTIAARLSRHYRGEWELPIPVDVAGYASRTGANTILNPDHVLITSLEGAFSGYTGLEMLFHEASHTLVTPRFGAVARAIANASSAVGRERPPDELWHVLLFYTAGRTVQRVLAERGVDYEPFLYSEGLFQRAWPTFREPVEEHWEAYLKGRIDMSEAARQILGAIER